MEDTATFLSCCDCQRHFPSLLELSRHRELLHPSSNQDSEEADSIPRPYRCQQCGRGYRHPGSLVNHRRTHETGLFPCTTCGKAFTNPMALKSHMRTHVPEGCRRRRPPYPKEATPHLQGETVATDSWGQRLGHGESCGNQKKRAEETSVSASGPDSGATLGTWEVPPTRQREGWESQPNPEEGAESWGPTTNSARATPLPSPASSLLSNLEQYLAESVVNFTGSQEPTQSPPAEEERRYKCSQCGKTYKHAGSLTNHRQSHTLGIYPCAICFKEFSNLMALKNHSRLHAQYRPYLCPHCPRAFRLPRELLEHQQSHESERQEQLWEEKGMPASNGHTDESSQDQLSSTLNGSGELEDSGLEEYRPFRCGDCGRTYRHAGSLINHRKSHQTGVYPCSICSKQLFNAAALKNHVRAHHRPQQGVGEDGQPSVPPAPLPLGETTHKEKEVPTTTLDHRPYKCSECGRAYRHRGSLVNHRHSHQIGEYQCSLCPRKYPNFMALRNHVRVHCKSACRSAGPGPKGPSSHLKVELPPDLVGTEAAPCTDQGNGCKHEEATDGTPAADRTAPQICSICGMLFEDPESHRPCHPPGIYQCSLCPKEFDSLPALRSHFQNHGPGEAAPAQPFLCCLCGMIFPGRAGYRLHRRQAHDSSGMTEGSEEEGEEEGAAVAASAHSTPLQLSEAELLNQLQREVEALEGTGYGHICGCCGQTYDDLGSLERHHQSQSSGNTTNKALSHLEASDDATEMVSDSFEGTMTSLSAEGGDTKSGEGVGVTIANSLCMHGKESSLEAQPRPFRCNQCGKTYRHGGSLVNHRKIHQTGDYICPVCSRCYPNLAAYRNHLRNHPRCKGSEPQVGPIPEAGGSSEPQNVAEEGLGQAEVRKFQEELKVEPPEEVARVKEEAWEETTVKGEEMELRLETAEKGCQTEASSERPFSCEVCGRSYKHAGSLINHRQSHQTGHFGCQACSKGFSNLMSLKNHRRIHADPRRFHCGDCGKAFRLRKQLASHQRVHIQRGWGTRKLTREDRPFRCGQCGRTYRHAGSLLNHRRSHETGGPKAPAAGRGDLLPPPPTPTTPLLDPSPQWPADLSFSL
uniref:Zinc finger protein 646 n=1 Tax=Rousettus aegyptiacus TaxID=9407 RepID=A0A7J8F599_ROUAE|nr:zinc finger protein 646 [Rousettus aegyptiacus]